MKTIAIIAAGGLGNRFSSSIPKQYTSSILRNTIKKFLNSNIDSIQVVIAPNDIELYNEAISGLDLLPYCFGGETRSHSVKNALNAIESYNPDFVLVHDACRPFVSTNLINEVIDKLKANPKHGVVPSIAMLETVKRITPEKVNLVNRENLFKIQTPQGFNFIKLVNAYKNTEDFYLFTDESSLMDHNNLPIDYIEGEKDNIKITYQKDIIMNFETRSGIGFDAHRFTDKSSENGRIILGGISIPFKKTLEAHSDGDVLIHSLVDALLGSIGSGDIGLHFPPSDMKWQNADSKLFLIHANELLKEKNAKINNIDIIVIAEKPHLSEYKEKIRNNLASILSISTDRVNLKATTTEKMGFIGREEGIAVQAMVTISFPTL